MKVRPWARTLTPLGWLAVLGVIVVLLAIGGRGLGVRWDPFGLEQRKLAAARTRLTYAEADAAARRVEAAEQAQQVARLETHHRQTQAVERATAAAVTQARSAEDAENRLDPVRGDRLRAHDRELCRLAVDPRSCAAAPAPAGGRLDALRPGGPA